MTEKHVVVSPSLIWKPPPLEEMDKDSFNTEGMDA